MKTKKNIEPTMKSILLSLAMLVTVLAAQAQSWTNYFDGPINGGDSPRAIAVDSSGDVVVAGASAGEEIDIGLAWATVKYSSTGDLHWAKRYKGPYAGPGNSADDIPAAIAIDLDGNAIVTGLSIGTSGQPEITTIKYSPDGTPLWTRKSGGGGGCAIAAETNGNTIVAATTAAGILTIKYSSAGAQLWAKSLPSGNSSPNPCYLALDSEGSVLVAGTKAWNSSYPFNYDFITVKYSSNGTPIWTNIYGSLDLTWNDEPSGLAVDSFGHVIVTGWMGKDRVDSSPVTLQYSKDGALLWSTNAGGDRVALDPADHAIVLGQFDDGGGGYARGIAKLSSTGQTLWTRVFGNPANRYEQPFTLAVGNNGNVFVVGTYGTFGNDCLTMAYSSEGDLIWTNQFGRPMSIYTVPVALTTDYSGSLFLVGDAGYGDSFSEDYVTIKYAAPGGTSPSILGLQRFGAEVVLSWDDAAFDLQSAPAITGTFTNIPGATSPHTNLMAYPQQYFRLAR